ncbi:MAG: aldo/keto reductase, partial [Sphingobacteriales bacterium]|nr:aldo/keto reductase [Sphingobacteriales bacterium]
DSIVRSGKALYVGISSYDAEQTRQAVQILKQLGTPCLIHQPKYSIFVRWVEDKNNPMHKSLLDVLGEQGVGCIPFSPLAQGLLTNKYLNGIPADSRVGRGLSNGAITQENISPETINRISQLNDIAVKRGQSLAQMAIAWLMKDNRVTSVLVGASSVKQLDDNLAAMNNPAFTKNELLQIEQILAS